MAVGDRTDDDLAQSDAAGGAAGGAAGDAAALQGNVLDNLQMEQGRGSSQALPQLAIALTSLPPGPRAALAFHLRAVPASRFVALACRPVALPFHLGASAYHHLLVEAEADRRVGGRFDSKGLRSHC